MVALVGESNPVFNRTLRDKTAQRRLALRWTGEKTECLRILLEEFRFDQVEDLAGCAAGSCDGAVDSEVRIGRRSVGRLEPWNCERVAPLPPYILRLTARAGMQGGSIPFMLCKQQRSQLFIHIAPRPDKNNVETGFIIVKPIDNAICPDAIGPKSG